MISTYFNPYTTNPYVMGQLPITQPQQMQLPQQQQPNQLPKVDGANEAMNRFLMQYPANMLVPGFVSEPIFDVNGRQFHTLSIEPDGRRNLETFDYKPHIEEIPSPPINQADIVTRQEFQAIVDKVSKLEASNGIHEPVRAATTTASQQSS